MKWIDELRRLLRGVGGREAMESPPGGLSCEEAAERVFEWLDGGLDQEMAEKVGTHLETCARCYPRLAFERAFQEALARVRQDETAPEKLRNEILESLKTEGFDSTSSG